MFQETLLQETLQEFPLKERNIKNTFLFGFVKRLLNDKSASNNNKMAYGYYPNILKDDGIAILI